MRGGMNDIFQKIQIKMGCFVEFFINIYFHKKIKNNASFPISSLTFEVIFICCCEPCIDANCKTVAKYDSQSLFY